MINRVLLYNSGGGIGDSIQILPLIDTLKSNFIKYQSCLTIWTTFPEILRFLAQAKKVQRLPKTPILSVFKQKLFSSLILISFCKPLVNY